MTERMRVEAGRSRRAILLRIAAASLLVLLYLGVGVFDHELWPPAEQAVAGVTWEMLAYGDLAVPTIDGLPYLEKPPLTYVLSWLSCRIAGHASAGLLRLPVALLGLLSLAIVWVACRRAYGDAVASLCTLLCATSFTFYELMHRASSDGVVLFFIFLCFALFLRTLDAAGPSRRPWLRDLPFCVALALSFYAKNFFSFLIVVPPVTLFLLATRQVRRLFTVGATSLVATVLALAPWCRALYDRGGLEYLRIVFFDNTLGRFLTIGDTASLHLGPLNDAFVAEKAPTPSLFAQSLAVHMMPWALIHAAALWSIFREKRGGSRRLFLRIAFVTTLVGVSLSSSASMQYYVPIVFVLILISGEFLCDLYDAGPGSARWKRAVVAANLAGVAVLVAAAPIAGAIGLRAPALAWLGIPNAIALFLLWRRFGRSPGGADAAAACALFVLASASLTLAAVMPRIDAVRSWRPFFDAVQGEVAGRRLATTIVNDRRLPAIEFYLQRRPEILRDNDEAVALLGSGEPVAVVMMVGDYEEDRARFDAVAHRTIRASSGRDLFVLLESP